MSVETEMACGALQASGRPWWFLKAFRSVSICSTVSLAGILFAVVLLFQPGLQAQASHGGSQQESGDTGTYQNPQHGSSTSGSRQNQKSGAGHNPGHMADWLSLHGNMTPTEQENALRSEPGFGHLPPQQQQRLIDRLNKLNAMPPQQRERTLQRMEAMERLAPEQRTQVRNAANELSAMPRDRQTMMRQAFRNLRSVPPGDRSAALNSGQYANSFSPHEKGVLNRLLSVEPYVPSNAHDAVQPQ